ncbi:MAG: hypothetical protein QM817_27660 [Archangium sp.]
MTRISGPAAPPPTTSTTRTEGPRTTTEPAAQPASKPAGAWGSSAPSTSAAERREKATGVTTQVASLTDAQNTAVVQKKTTCPFIGTAVKQGALPVRNNAEKPLGSIDDVAKLGNTGPGSDLGEVLKLFAKGNHAFMPGMSGKLDMPVPQGTFSLDFPGSQGSHAGDSGILQSDPRAQNSGRFSDEAFAKLLATAKDGRIKRSDIGKFIAHNVMADPKANAPGLKTTALLAKDFAKLAAEVAEQGARKATGKSSPEETRKIYEKLTKLLGEDNLIGSAGEFGLMAAFLANSPNTKQVGGEPAYSVAELTAMFKEKKFPEGWENWKKSSTDWVHSTVALTVAAEKEVLKQKLL